MQIREVHVVDRSPSCLAVAVGTRVIEIREGGDQPGSCFFSELQHGAWVNTICLQIAVICPSGCLWPHSWLIQIA